MRKSNSAFYVGGSVLLIMFAIAATAIVSQINSGGTASSADIRARAGVAATLRAIGTVSSVDTLQNTLQINNLRFVQSTGEVSNKNLGSWIVTPPRGFNLATLATGSTVTITINPQTFITSSRTVSATQIIIER